MKMRLELRVLLMLSPADSLPFFVVDNGRCLNGVISHWFLSRRNALYDVRLEGDEYEIIAKKNT